MKSVFSLLALAPVAFAAFGVQTSGSDMVVDSGDKLVFTVNTKSGDITSIKYSGTELQDKSKFTQLSSGLGSADVSSTADNGVAVVTISTDTINHYYIVKEGENTIYIGTNASKEPDVGELRFIARLNKSALPNGIPESDVDGGEAIEGSDVFKIDGETRSKFYSSVRHIEDNVHGVSGDGVGVYMIIPPTSYEKSSGGPFHRDINNQGTSQQELYWYMNSNHEQTEAYRTGFFGPYAMAITSGDAPSADIDLSFIEDLGLKGYVASSDRGSVSGTYSGTADGLDVTIGFKVRRTGHLSGSLTHFGFQNDDAQYWVSGSGGKFSRDSIIPGTYNATLFQGELEVGTGSVTVAAGKSADLKLESTLDAPGTVWSIGTLDGTPAGFLNADKIEKMHPSDSRMASWGPVTFTVGTDDASAFPMAQFKAVNDPTTISWKASDSDIGERTLRIRTTSSFASGRPSVKVNDWNSDSPAAPPKIDSRGVTRGTWRGFNQVYDFVIPDGTLVSGDNTIEISVVSGSSGDSFLSPNFVYDSVELI
ncbi:polysaccharide lyase family 4 protein [Schizophyllum commune H4-8]|uniref:rhamnogalacturonan endolyase n=1 Tax=Schizophyllum commune (strain H4-8 / FGSC 9210) TaxID=578458 RepID=D8Q086_SCHCM|nr:polysaccharide lyase family 4 protein [Schizophyllum commune H4-8]KAI5896691.1 polysaccharide lyase family 4 protein [Schizophyllum commune H4-8]